MKIGITIRIQDVNNKEAFVIYKRYIDFIKDAEVVLITPDTSDELLGYCDKFIITGGDDLNPSLYNEKNYDSKDVNDQNDELDFKIIKHAYTMNKTILGICRGIQSINVYFGGTLTQHFENHMRVIHDIKKVTEPRLYKKEILYVNSYHHQVINKVANDLIVTYESDDGVVEIIEHKEKNIIGVQYHPEISTNKDDEMLYNMLKII